MFLKNDKEETQMPVNAGIPTAKVIAAVHSRVHFCREAAIVRLKGGLDRLV